LSRLWELEEAPPQEKRSKKAFTVGGWKWDREGGKGRTYWSIIKVDGGRA